MLVPTTSTYKPASEVNSELVKLVPSEHNAAAMLLLIHM